MRVVTKAVDMVWYTLASGHLMTIVRPPCIFADLQFHTTYATHASITTKREREVKGRAHVSFVSVAVRVAL